MLFACVFTGYAPGMVDSAIDNETFKTIVNALTRGLHTYFQLEKERARIESHSLFFCPRLTTRQYSSTPTGTYWYIRPPAWRRLSGWAWPRRAVQKLVFINKQIESGLQMLLAETNVRHAAAAPNGHSVYIGDQNGALSRVSIEAVVPAAETSSRETTYVLIRVCEPADLPDEVEAVLQHHYDLSQSEAHLARHLTLSGSMNVTAAQLGITRNTAKKHICGGSTRKPGCIPSFSSQAWFTGLRDFSRLRVWPHKKMGPQTRPLS
ncbi:hypothetical protein QW131_02390 [Roseibium salinum]|nr:hypothetical protein [Roseibium salinum]